MLIQLTPAEAEEATSIGLRREALRQSRGKALKRPRDGGGSWAERNIVGSMAELAVAKHFGVLERWRAEQAFSLEHEKITADVGSRTQVRATGIDHGNLLLHDYDPDQRFICAVVNLPARTVDLKGWIHARLGKSKAYWRSTGPFASRPCFVVDVSDLFDIHTIGDL